MSKTFINAINKNNNVPEGRTIIYPGKEAPETSGIKLRTGIFPIDYLSRGGIPAGQIIRIFGPPSSGKSYLAQAIIKENQDNFFGRKLRVLYVDAEDSFSPTWATKLGVNLDCLEVFKPESGEQIIDVVQEAITENIYDLFVIDSLAEMTSMKMLDTSAEDSVAMGLQARLINGGLGRWVRARVYAKNRNDETVQPTVLLLNHVLSSMSMYGNPEFTPGGKKQEFVSALDIRLERKQIITDADEIKSLFAVDLDKETGKEKKGQSVSSLIQVFLPKSKQSQSNQAAQFHLWTSDDTEKNKLTGQTASPDMVFDRGLFHEIIYQVGKSYIAKIAGKEITLGTKIDEVKQLLLLDDVLRKSIETNILDHVLETNSKKKS